MASILELLRSDVRSRDESEFSLGDTLDVKASILLVVVIFLAGVTGGALTSGASHSYLRWIQLICAIFLLLSGVLAVYVVWPRKYLMETENRQTELLRYLAEEPAAMTDPSIAEMILKEDILKANERIVHNHAVNATKSQALQWAFYAVIPALLLELVNAVAVFYLPTLLKGHVF